MIRRLYPNGKKKAFVISYDDGVLQDIPFVKLLNKYNLKGTFNLNSGLMKSEFRWTHESGLVVKRLSADKAKELYQGHEVASHTLTHPYMDTLSREDILEQMKMDKENLEKLFGREVKGFAVPFTYYSELIAKCARDSGFEYVRTSDESLSFIPDNDFFSWRSTLFHLSDKLSEFTDAFEDTHDELACFQLVGHSYDLDTENMWSEIDSVFARIASHSDILSMTNIDLVRYLKAHRTVEIGENYIINNSKTETLWFNIDDTVVSVDPKKSIKY